MAIKNSATTDDNIASCIKYCVRQETDALRVATPAYVTAVNEQNHTVSVQPLSREFINTKDAKKKAVQLPIITNVPYMLVLKPNIGDFCILLHLDCSINTKKTFLQKLGNFLIPWLKASQKKKHNLSDCIALIGFNNPSQDSSNLITNTNIAGGYTTHELESQIILDKIYPIGSVYMTTDSTFNPNIVWGGYWELIQDRVLAGAGGDWNPMTQQMSANTNTNYPGIIGVSLMTYGNKTHKHNIITTPFAAQAGAGSAVATVSETEASNIPPYYLVYIWERKNPPENKTTAVS
jgi:hypothetical protein